MLGHKQQAIIEIGRNKGFVNIDDLNDFYKSRREIINTMNTLVILGYFEKPKLTNKLVWKIKK